MCDRTSPLAVQATLPPSQPLAHPSPPLPSPAPLFHSLVPLRLAAIVPRRHFRSIKFNSSIPCRGFLARISGNRERFSAREGGRVRARGILCRRRDSKARQYLPRARIPDQSTVFLLLNVSGITVEVRLGHCFRGYQADRLPALPTVRRRSVGLSRRSLFRGAVSRVALLPPGGACPLCAVL